MAILNIVKEGDSVLRGKCREVTEITPRIITLLDDMAETLHDQTDAVLRLPRLAFVAALLLWRWKRATLSSLSILLL